MPSYAISSPSDAISIGLLQEFLPEQILSVLQVFFKKMIKEKNMFHLQGSTLVVKLPIVIPFFGQDGKLNSQQENHVRMKEFVIFLLISCTYCCRKVRGANMRTRHEA